MALGSVQPLREMGREWQRWPLRATDNLTTFTCRLSRNLEVSISWSFRGLSMPVKGLLFLTYIHDINVTNPMH